MTSVDTHTRTASADQVETFDETSVTQLNASTQTGVAKLAHDDFTTPVIGDEPNPFSGGFVNRDPGVFIGKDVSRAGNQIKHLRSRLIRLIPVEDNLIYLTQLREPLIINSCINDKPIDGTLLAVPSYINNSLVVHESNKSNSAKEHLSELSSIETQLSLNLEPLKLSKLMQCMSEIANEIELRIAEVNRSFDSAVFPALSRDEFVEAMMFKIGHQKLREEAKMHLSVIRKLLKMLDGDLLTSADFDVLSDKAQAAVGVMVAIEKRRMLVEELVRSDQKQRIKTIRLVSRYSVIAICLAVALPIIAVFAALISNNSPLKESLKALGLQIPVNLSTASLNELKVPLLGIPEPVIIWSLIGSFAAMIHRFNRRPIEDFDDAMKWMLTRPVQGVVLGSAFYLVLNSGLFPLTGSNNSNFEDEVILVLSFLVGFSDRFVDSVFNALVERYSIENVSQEKNQINQSKGTEPYSSNVSITQYKRRQIKSDKQHDPE